VKFNYQIFPYAFVVGAVAGLAGAMFGKILFYIVQKRKQVHDIKTLFYVSMTIGLGVACLIYFAGPMVGGSGRDMITQMLFDNKKSTVSIVVARYISAILAYANGGAGGIFAPSLGMGASIGAFISEFLNMSNQNLFTMLGMVAFLTGVTRAPFTSFVLVLEMTDRHSVIMPVMIAAVSAQIFARFVGKHSFYEQVKFIYMDNFKLTRHPHVEEERL
jgi:H+/Cl- antiporter ClcA